jgi:hypothetical protein
LLVTAGADFLTRLFDKLRVRIKKSASNVRLGNARLTRTDGSYRRIVYSAFIVSVLLLSLLYIPLFATPNVGIAETNSYQAMTKSGYEAIEWIKTHTPAGSVLVADAYYGWWLSGFAERPTLAAVDPQYLILAHEFEAARVAGHLLETNYLIDNGLLRVKQNVPYADSSLELSGWLNDSYVPYQLFSLNESQVDFVYREDNVPNQFSFSRDSPANMRVENHSDYASFIITRESQLFNCTFETTLYPGTRFAKVSITLQASTEGVSFDWLHLPFQQRGVPTQYANTIASIDKNAQAISQIILPEDTLDTNVFRRENPDSFELVWNLEGKSTAQVEFFVGLTQYQIRSGDRQTNYLQDLIINNTRTYLDRTSDSPVDFFDYKTSIEEWNVSYVIIRDAEAVPRFAQDSFFSLVFRNSEVAVFQAKRN